MPHFTLDQISKMPQHVQAQVIAQMGPKTALPVSSPAPEVETPPEPKEQPCAWPAKMVSDFIRNKYPDAAWGPVYIPADQIRLILDGWASAFHVAGTETQRRKVVDNCVQALARREGNPNSIP